MISGGSSAKCTWRDPPAVRSLGCLLYVMLSGLMPFWGSDMKDVLSKTRCAAYTMDASEWDAVSKEAKNLVDRLLTVDVEKRATADDVFNHPWMAADARVRKVHLPHFCANRRRYSMRRKFKAAVIAVIAERRLLKLGNVRIVERANTLSEEQLESAFPSKESATSTGQPHLKKVASLTSSGLDKTEYKGKACDEKPASGGWFSYK